MEWRNATIGPNSTILAGVVGYDPSLGRFIGIDPVRRQISPSNSAAPATQAAAASGPEPSLGRAALDRNSRYVRSFLGA